MPRDRYAFLKQFHPRLASNEWSEHGVAPQPRRVPRYLITVLAFASSDAPRVLAAVKREFADFKTYEIEQHGWESYGENLVRIAKDRASGDWIQYVEQHTKSEHLVSVTIVRQMTWPEKQIGAVKAFLHIK
jgi:hypothetical protein